MENSEDVAVTEEADAGFFVLGVDSGSIWVEHGVRGFEDPDVVGVLVRVAGHLLACRRNTAVVVPERVAVRVRVQKDRGRLVPQSDVGVVRNRETVPNSSPALEFGLESVAHKRVSWPAPRQQVEMEPEPQQVEENGHKDEPKSAGHKVADKGVEAHSAAPVQHSPEVKQGGDADEEDDK